MLERLTPLFKSEGIKKLSAACVAVIGIGGVGGEAVIALVRSGIGKIIIQDFDVVEISNINRQFVADTKTLGKSKVLVMKERIQAINPSCEVIALNSYFNEDNMMIFAYNPDFVIDAIDSIDSKILLINECITRKVDFISSMGAARKIDPTKISVIRIDKTTYDPIAKILRNKFKNEKFMTVSSSESPKCQELGSYMPVVATFSLLLADYVIKKIVEEN